MGNARITMTIAQGTFKQYARTESLSSSMTGDCERDGRCRDVPVSMQCDVMDAVTIASCDIFVACIHVRLARQCCFVLKYTAMRNEYNNLDPVPAREA